MSRPALVGAKILEILHEKHILSATSLILELERLETGVNKTSVYRALEKLVQNGQVCKQVFTNDELVYELRTHHHDHLVCLRCNSVESVRCETKVAKKVKGFIVDHHHTTFFGTCKKCACLLVK